MYKPMEIPAMKYVAKIRTDFLVVSVQEFMRFVECVEYWILIFVHMLKLLRYEAVYAPYNNFAF